MSASSVSLNKPGGFMRNGYSLVVLAVLFVIMHFLGPRLRAAGIEAEQLVIPGFLLLLGVYAGRLVEGLRLPHLTGYIVIGIIAGPEVFELVTYEQTKEVQIVNELAIGLIAFLAGSEIRLGWLAARWPSIVALSTGQLLLIPLVTLLTFLGLMQMPWAAQLLPFVGHAAEEGVGLWSLGILLGILLLANSPTVAVSVIKQMRAKGPVSETVLGVSVVKDIYVIIAFSILVGILGSASSDESSADILLGTMGKILLSLILGTGIGLILRYYLSSTDRRLPWILVGLALLVTFLQDWHIKPLFCMLAAGFACENMGRENHRVTRRLHRGLSRVSGPIFVLFFVGVGLSLHIHELLHSWHVILFFALLRAATLYVTFKGFQMIRVTDKQVGKYAWYGMLPQAGVTLALIEIVSTSFPTWGLELSTFVVGLVALHELLGPLLFSAALRGAGEAGDQQEEEKLNSSGSSVVRSATTAV